MAEFTKIQWCDHTFNPWRIAKGTRIVAAERSWKQPAKWHVAAQRDGVRRKVFCASLADVFEEWGGSIACAGTSDDPINLGVCDDTGEWVRGGGPFSNVRAGTIGDVRRRLFALIDATQWLDWLILTKRPENVRRMWPVRGVSTDGTTTACMGPPPIGARNVWLLTSVSDQQTADAMVPALLACRDLVPVLGLSCEPLLGPVDLFAVPRPDDAYFRWRGEVGVIGDRHEPDDYVYAQKRLLDWVIVGGESGPDARPCDVAWIRSIVGQCKAANVPCFVKQLGAKPREVRGDELWGLVGLRDPKGGDPAEWPEDLRVQELPKHA